MALCECGCGEEVTEDSRFIRGHNARVQKVWGNPKNKSYDRTCIIERFESKIEIDDKTGCWIWNGWRSEGYGGFYCCYEGKGKIYPAHRLSYMIYNRDIPDELQVLHKCNNKPCVNPEHLYIGTHQDNMNDLRDAGTLAGRNNPNFGVLCSNEKKKKISDSLIKYWKSKEN